MLTTLQVVSEEDDMSNLSVEYPEISKMVLERHDVFLKKFGSTIAKLDGDHTIATTRIRAKLDLFAKAFLHSGVIDEVSYGMVSSRDGVFPMSMCIGRKGVCLYLLNTGKDVVVSDSVGLGQSISMLDSRIVLVTDTKRVCKRFCDVLDDDFDWMKMAEFVLEAVHEVMYDRDEARRIMLFDKFGS